MIEIGKYNDLSAYKATAEGWFLTDNEGEEILLASKFCPDKLAKGDQVKVFVYQGHEGEKIATTQIPKILVDEFALLKVVGKAPFGAFLDWGMEKDLLVPNSMQQQKMEEGRWYMVYMDIDPETNRLFASSKIDDMLQNFVINVQEGEEVVLLVLRKSDLGFEVIVNNEHRGLVYDNDIFKPLNVGDKLKGYVKKIREDKKLDITLQPMGYRNFNDANSELIFSKLSEHGGEIFVNDKSSPEEIYRTFGISKKAFKKAIGALYKQRKIEITVDGIKSV